MGELKPKPGESGQESVLTAQIVKHLGQLLENVGPVPAKQRSKIEAALRAVKAAAGFADADIERILNKGASARDKQRIKELLKKRPEADLQEKLTAPKEAGARAESAIDALVERFTGSAPLPESPAGQAAAPFSATVMKEGEAAKAAVRAVAGVEPGAAHRTLEARGAKLRERLRVAIDLLTVLRVAGVLPDDDIIQQLSSLELNTGVVTDTAVAAAADAVTTTVERRLDELVAHWDEAENNLFHRLQRLRGGGVPGWSAKADDVLRQYGALRSDRQRDKQLNIQAYLLAIHDFCQKAGEILDSANKPASERGQSTASRGARPSAEQAQSPSAVNRLLDELPASPSPGSAGDREYTSVSPRVEHFDELTEEAKDLLGTLNVLAAQGFITGREANRIQALQRTVDGQMAHAATDLLAVAAPPDWSDDESMAVLQQARDLLAGTIEQWDDDGYTLEQRLIAVQSQSGEQSGPITALLDKYTRVRQHYLQDPYADTVKYLLAIRDFITQAKALVAKPKGTALSAEEVNVLAAAVAERGGRGPALAEQETLASSEFTVGQVLERPAEGIRPASRLEIVAIGQDFITVRLTNADGSPMETSMTPEMIKRNGYRPIVERPADTVPELRAGQVFMEHLGEGEELPPGEYFYHITSDPDHGVVSLEIKNAVGEVVSAESEVDVADINEHLGAGTLKELLSPDKIDALLAEVAERGVEQELPFKVGEVWRLQSGEGYCHIIEINPANNAVVVETWFGGEGYGSREKLQWGFKEMSDAIQAGHRTLVSVEEAKQLMAPEAERRAEAEVPLTVGQVWQHQTEFGLVYYRIMRIDAAAEKVVFKKWSAVLPYDDPHGDETWNVKPLRQWIEDGKLTLVPADEAEQLMNPTTPKSAPERRAEAELPFKVGEVLQDKREGYSIYYRILEMDVDGDSTTEFWDSNEGYEKRDKVPWASAELKRLIKSGKFTLVPADEAKKLMEPAPERRAEGELPFKVGEVWGNGGSPATYFYITDIIKGDTEGSYRVKTEEWSADEGYGKRRAYDDPVDTILTRIKLDSWTKVPPDQAKQLMEPAAPAAKTKGAPESSASPESPVQVIKRLTERHAALMREYRQLQQSGKVSTGDSARFVSLLKNIDTLFTELGRARTQEFAAKAMLVSEQLTLLAQKLAEIAQRPSGQTAVSADGVSLRRLLNESRLRVHELLQNKKSTVDPALARFAESGGWQELSGEMNQLLESLKGPMDPAERAKLLAAISQKTGLSSSAIETALSNQQTYLTDAARQQTFTKKGFWAKAGAVAGRVVGYGIVGRQLNIWTGGTLAGIGLGALRLTDAALSGGTSEKKLNQSLQALRQQIGADAGLTKALQERLIADLATSKQREIDGWSEWADDGLLLGLARLRQDVAKESQAEQHYRYNDYAALRAEYFDKIKEDIRVNLEQQGQAPEKIELLARQAIALLTVQESNNLYEAHLRQQHENKALGSFAEAQWLKKLVSGGQKVSDKMMTSAVFSAAGYLARNNQTVRDVLSGFAGWRFGEAAGMALTGKMKKFAELQTVRAEDLSGDDVPDELFRRARAQLLDQQWVSAHRSEYGALKQRVDGLLAEKLRQAEDLVAATENFGTSLAGEYRRRKKLAAKRQWIVRAGKVLGAGLGVLVGENIQDWASWFAEKSPPITEGVGTTVDQAVVTGSGEVREQFVRHAESVGLDPKPFLSSDAAQMQVLDQQLLDTMGAVSQVHDPAVQQQLLEQAAAEHFNPEYTEQLQRAVSAVGAVELPDATADQTIAQSLRGGKFNPEVVSNAQAEVIASQAAAEVGAIHESPVPGEHITIQKGWGVEHAYKRLLAAQAVDNPERMAHLIALKEGQVQGTMNTGFMYDPERIVGIRLVADPADATVPFAVEYDINDQPASAEELAKLTVQTQYTPPEIPVGSSSAAESGSASAAVLDTAVPAGEVAESSAATAAAASATVDSETAAAAVASTEAASSGTEQSTASAKGIEAASTAVAAEALASNPDASHSYDAGNYKYEAKGYGVANLKVDIIKGVTGPEVKVSGNVLGYGESQMLDELNAHGDQVLIGNKGMMPMEALRTNLQGLATYQAAEKYLTDQGKFEDAKLVHEAIAHTKQLMNQKIGQGQDLFAA